MHCQECMHCLEAISGHQAVLLHDFFNDSCSLRIPAGSKEADPAEKLLTLTAVGKLAMALTLCCEPRLQL